MRKPKSNQQSELTQNEVLDQAIVLLLQSAQMIEDVLTAPKLAYKPLVREQAKKIRQQAKYFSKFVRR